MKIEVIAEANELVSPIRFATAIIEKCMEIKKINEDVDLNYLYLKEVNEHIDVFLKGFYKKGSVWNDNTI